MLNNTWVPLLKGCHNVCKSATGRQFLFHTRRAAKLSERGKLKERPYVEEVAAKAKDVQSLQKSAGEFVAANAIFKKDRKTSEIILKTGAFAIGFTGCCFVGCSVWKENNDVNEIGNRIGPKLKPNPFDLSHKVPHKHADSVSEQIKEWWKAQSVGHKWYVAIAGINLLVFVGWRIPALQTTFLRYFASSAFSKALLSPMLLSSFSHQSALHLLVNMYVLHSFGVVVCDQVTGFEQLTFLFLSGAVWGSFTGLAHKALTRNPVFALGASGAVLALLGYTCCRLENARLSIVFLPMFTFSAQNALIGIAALDICGIIFKWKLMDHACHLGGLFFGIWYAKWGERWLWHEKRLQVNQWFRSRSKDI